MKKYLSTALTLFLICAFFAFLLSLVNKITLPQITRNQERAILQGLKDVISENTSVNMSKGEVKVHKDGINSYYIVLNNNADKIGYVLNLQGTGYGGALTLLAYYDISGKLVKSKLLDNSETAGIGKKYENDDNIAIFASYDEIPTIKSELNASDVSVVSGASISFQGIGEALKKGKEYIENTLNGGDAL